MTAAAFLTGCSGYSAPVRLCETCLQIKGVGKAPIAGFVSGGTGVLWTGSLAASLMTRTFGA